MVIGDERYIPIQANGKSYNVWTQKLGENPDLKVLLVHGGPGASHLCFKIIEEYFPEGEFEFYYYDQLGSYKSDQPDDLSLWTIERFVDEVEQVRIALGLNKDNFILLGQSWGGMLAMEYALKYQDNLKGLVIDSMQASIKDYMIYARDVLAPQLKPESVKRIMELEASGDYENEEYMALLYPYYEKFVLGMPMNDLPEAISGFIANLNHQVYGYMNGPSEFTCVGTLKDWDVKDQLKEIKVPTLVIGSTNNTMDPEQMKWMASEMQNGEYLHCEGSHSTMWNTPETYFAGLKDFLLKIK